MNKAQGKFFIRKIQKNDLLELVQLEEIATDFPWSEKAHQDAITQNYPSLLIEIQSDIAAFIVFNAYVDECHLLNLVVKPEYQGHGFAKQLFQAMYQYAIDSHLSRIILEVRISNVAAINLYRQLGFKQIGERKNYYRGNPNQDLAREDAIVMEKIL